MAIPGQWLALQHKLRDVSSNAASFEMVVNDRKTKLLIFNDTTTKQAVPLVSAVDGFPLQCVSEIKLLGLIFD